METNVNYTLVGAFVISLTVLIILGAIWLTTGLTTEEYTYYKIYMKESVSGLSLDEPVEFNGVAVGKIEDIKINRKNPQLVELLLKIKCDTPVTEGTTATLSMRGITGITFIALEDKGTERTPLKKAQDEQYPVIKTKPSIFVRLDIALTQMSDSFADLTKSFNLLLSPENLRTIKKILRSGQNSMEILETKTLPSAEETTNNLNKITHDLSEISNELKQNPAILIRGKSQPQELGPGE